MFNYLTLGRTMRMGGECLPPPRPLRFFCFFLDDKTLAPEVFCSRSCSFIPSTHFETSLVMVSYYGYEIRRHK